MGRFGSVAPQEVQRGYGQLGINITFDEAALFVQRYDRDLDGRLNFNEFSRAFVAHDAYYS